MGVFLLTTNFSLEEKRVEGVLSSKGHKNISVRKSDRVCLIHAGKILVPNKNFWDSSVIGGDPDDYILGIGTFFYKGAAGEEALKLIWEYWDEVLKDNSVFGHWAFVVHKHKKTYVVNDMTGTLRLYYTIEGNNVTVSSSLTSVISSLSNPEFDKVRLGAFISVGLGGHVPFIKGVENFNPKEYLVIDQNSESYSFVKKAIPAIERIETLDRAVEYVKKLFKQQIEQLKVLGNERVSVELTGGLDSRLIASNLKSEGFNYEFINYPIYTPDREVAEFISKSLRRRLLIQTDIRLNDGDVNKYYGEFDNGFNFRRQYANPRWKVENKYQFSGALGECINTPYLLESNNLGDRTIDYFLSHIIGGDILKENYRELYINYLKAYYISRGFDSEKQLTEREIAEFEGILQGELSGDFMYNSGCQAHLFYYNMYTEWHFNHFVSDIAFDVKSGRKLSLALIKSIDSELGSYPFLSRLHTKGKSVNETSELSIHYFSYMRVKQLLPKSWINYIYEKKGRSFDKKLMKTIDFSFYDDMINTKELSKYPVLHFDEINRLYSVEVLRTVLGIK